MKLQLFDESAPIMGATTMNNNMNNLSAKKPWNFARICTCLVVFSTLGVAILVLYYASYNNFGEFSPSLQGSTASSFNGSKDDISLQGSSSSFNGTKDEEILVKDEFYELRKVLEAAATKEKTVILTTLNEAWAAPNSIFDLFLKSFRIGDNTAHLLNHLLVIAVDEKAYIKCQTLVSHCYFLKSKESSQMAHEAKFMTPIYNDMMWERLAFLQQILSLGYNFVFTDTDVMWFRNPFPHFTPDSDYQMSCDHFNGDEFDLQNFPNNGYLFVRSNIRTIKFYKFWVSSRSKDPRSNEQSVFNVIKNSTYVRNLGVKLRFLDTQYFSGFCSPSKDFNKVCTMHANCCFGSDRKIVDLNAILEDWKTYMSSDHTLPQLFHWNAPKQCKK